MLEQILDSFLAYIETFIQGKNSKIYRVHLERATNHLEQASSEFLKNLERLGRVLHFYDRNLATLFAHIHYSKKGVLRNVFMFFVESSRKEVEKSYNDRYLFEDSSINKSGNQQVAKFKDVAIDQYHRGIEYTIPNNELMNLDLTEYLDGITRRADKSSFNPFYDPSDPRNIFAAFSNNDDHWSILREYQDMVVNVIMNNIEEGYIGYEDKDKLIALYPILKSHRELLGEVRERLGQFIQQQFTLEDLLYVVK